MLGKGLEPSRLTARASKTLVSTIPPPEQDAVSRESGQSGASEASVVLIFTREDEFPIFRVSTRSITNHPHHLNFKCVAPSSLPFLYLS